MAKIAFAGCGHIHTPGFMDKVNDRKDSITTVKVWDHDGERAREAAEKLGASVAGTMDEILSDGSIDGVVVCSETDRHEELVIAAAEAGKHLFIEKPLGFGVEDARKMASAIEKAGVIFQTGYFMRGNPINMFLKEQIKAGAFGKITNVRYSNCHAGSLKGWFDTKWRWMADPKQAGCGAFGDLGTHALDILMWWFGDEVEKATAVIKTVLGRYGDCDETGEGILIFPGEITANLTAGWMNLANPVMLQINGTDGHAAVIDGKLRLWGENFDCEDGAKFTGLPEGLPHAFDLYLDALLGKDVPLVGVREAAARNAVMAALYESSNSGSWVVPQAI
ncbi:MAG: Gfo/Idh/MocA family oxidoreductase [Planctomycetes bacterium]|nr:Gfo/Idh/MocA family oxidoreductase [Planctomycetota bacterium]